MKLSIPFLLYSISFSKLTSLKVIPPKVWVNTDISEAINLYVFFTVRPSDLPGVYVHVCVCELHRVGLTAGSREGAELPRQVQKLNAGQGLSQLTV